MKSRRTAAHLFRLAAAIALGFGSMAAAQAQDAAPGLAPTFSVLHHFTGWPRDGQNPTGALTPAGDGGYYGATAMGGFPGFGTIYELNADGTVTLLHSFSSDEGQSPNGWLVSDAQGDLYGTAQSGGSGSDFVCPAGCGTIFKLVPDGHLAVLYQFDNQSGYAPLGGLLRDAEGNLFGTTNLDQGTAFMLTPSGQYTILHYFQGRGGYAPEGGLIQDSVGNIYGTTRRSVSGSGGGVVYQLTQSGEYTVLHDFYGGHKGITPSGGVVGDADGNLYGVTTGGGNASCQPDGCGTVFKLAPDGTLTMLYRFKNPADGFSPQSLVVDEAAGVLYGTTAYGGPVSARCPSGCGTVFMIVSKGDKRTLHTFHGIDGDFPNSLIKGQGSELIGTTSKGGSRGAGVIFRLQFSQ